MNSDTPLSGAPLGSSNERADTASTDPPSLRGVHHVRIPVSDVTASADWYGEVFGLQVLLVEEEENEVVGIVFSLGEGSPSVGLHHDPQRAAALAGFCVVAMAIDSREALSGWDSWLNQIDAVHSPMVQGVLGWYIDISGPDGLIVQLHTPEHPSVEDS
jgi:catechol 2,3-dioxygenase-like lactoylglutathione lyase family enzyme